MERAEPATELHPKTVTVILRLRQDVLDIKICIRNTKQFVGKLLEIKRCIALKMKIKQIVSLQVDSRSTDAPSITKAEQYDLYNPGLLPWN